MRDHWREDVTKGSAAHHGNANYSGRINLSCREHPDVTTDIAASAFSLGDAVDVIHSMSEATHAA